MKHEIYNALKDRIGIVPIGNNKTAYRFYNVGLNKGIEDESDVLYIESIVFGDPERHSIWNACQMAYKYLRWMLGNVDASYIDSRLLNV